MLQQVEGGVAVVLEVELRVVCLQLPVAHGHERFAACLGFVLHLLHVELDVVAFAVSRLLGIVRLVFRRILGNVGGNVGGGIVTLAFFDVKFHRLLFGVVKHLGVRLGGYDFHLCRVVVLASAHLKFHLIK